MSGMTETEMTDAELDALFAEAATLPDPSAALVARVLADADAERLLRLQPQPRPPATPKPGFWARLADMFGGGGALAGMASAAVAGLYFGFVQPEGLTTLTGIVTGDFASSLSVGLTGDTSVDSVDLMPGIDALLTEE